MATAALPQVLAPDLAHASPAAWWRRAHSYSLPVVIAIEIAATWLVVKLAEAGYWAPPAGEILTAAMIGFIIAQCFLLGLWAALGGLPTIARWLLVGAVYVVGATTMAQPLFEGNWENFLEVAPEFILLGGVLLSTFAVMLLPLRRLAAWRIDFDEAYHAHSRRPRGQVGMMDFAALFCAVALPLTLCRVLAESSREEGMAMLLFVVLFALLVGATAAPVAYAVLVRRRLALWLVIAAAWVLAMSWGQSLAARVLPELDLFDMPHGVAGLHWTALAFHAAVAAAVGVPLVALRCCGLKLLTVSRAA
jgi:hypothetical protein